jgi:hypothetical protein
MGVFVNHSQSAVLFIGICSEIPFEVLHIRPAVHAELNTFGHEQLSLQIAAF